MYWLFVHVKRVFITANNLFMTTNVIMHFCELDEFDPPLMPPKTIDDPSDTKPEDWVDEKMIDDPEDPPPVDWVTEATVVDPDATQPDDWDEEMDGGMCIQSCM